MAKWGFRNIKKQVSILWDNYTKYCPQKGVEGSKKLKLTQQSKTKKIQGSRCADPKIMFSGWE